MPKIEDDTEDRITELREQRRQLLNKLAATERKLMDIDLQLAEAEGKQPPGNLCKNDIPSCLQR
jgi:hypothetical protein